MSIPVEVHKRSRMVHEEGDMYRRVRSVNIDGVTYASAQDVLNVLLKWYWRCRDGTSIILNGMPQWEADLLFRLGVLREPVTYGIQLAMNAALPQLVEMADQISIALSGREVRGACSISAAGIQYFMDRLPERPPA